jgi:carbonic anhydrase
MKNKLFLICPDSQLEAFIKEQYGQGVFFLTALGAVFNFQETNYVEALGDFLKREAIEEIFVVQDTSCRFMNSILEQEKGFGTKAEQVMLELFIENYSNIMAGASQIEKKKILAKVNIRRQALEILSHELLLIALGQSQIKLKGLITTKSKGQLEEVNVRLQEIRK